MKKTHTLYTAIQAIWGADRPRTLYFETIKERNAYVRSHDYCNSGNPVKLTEEEFNFWKSTGCFYPC